MVETVPSATIPKRKISSYTKKLAGTATIHKLLKIYVCGLKSTAVEGGTNGANLFFS